MNKLIVKRCQKNMIIIQIMFSTHVKAASECCSFFFFCYWLLITYKLNDFGHQNISIKSALLISNYLSGS